MGLRGSIILILVLMPRKIRQLIKDLEKAGFEFEPVKGSHRKYRHPLTTEVMIVSGQLGDDCRRYQEEDLRRTLANLGKMKKGKSS